MSTPFQQPFRNSAPFTAKYAGICGDCEEGFEAGTEVRYNDDNLVHADPDECLRFRDRPIQRPCTSCFLVHAGECF